MKCRIFKAEDAHRRIFCQRIAINNGYQAVIRPHKILVSQSGNDAPPLGAHPGIDHAYEHRSGRKIWRAAPKQQGGMQNILMGDRMAEVNDLQIRRKPKHDAFHDRRVSVSIGEIGQQSGNFHFRTDFNKLCR